MLKRESGEQEEAKKSSRSPVPVSDLLYEGKEEKTEIKIRSGKHSFILPVVVFLFVFLTPPLSGDFLKAEFLINCVRASIIDALSVVLLQRPFGGQRIASKEQE